MLASNSGKKNTLLYVMQKCCLFTNHQLAYIISVFFLRVRMQTEKTLGGIVHKEVLQCLAHLNQFLELFGLKAPFVQEPHIWNLCTF